MHNALQPTDTPAPGPAEHPPLRPKGRRIALALLLAGVLALGGTLALHWDAARALAKRGLAAFLATYEEMYALSVEEAGAAEYVVFVQDADDRATWAAFFAGEPTVRLEREGDLPGTLVVTLLGDPREGLERLRAQPFVQLAVRNRGALFCH